MKPSVAIIGASNDRSKFGNKAVRAYLQEGYDVYPVHPTETTIEDLKVFKSILDVPAQKLDRISVYVPPAVGLRLLPDIAKKSCRELWLNPGSESDDIIDRATDLKLNVIVACSIVGIGVNPSDLK
jgi:hypothetical protein